jgi:hypothetical protein
MQLPFVACIVTIDIVCMWISILLLVCQGVNMWNNIPDLIWWLREPELDLWFGNPCILIVDLLLAVFQMHAVIVDCIPPVYVIIYDTSSLEYEAEPRRTCASSGAII